MTSSLARAAATRTTNTKRTTTARTTRTTATTTEVVAADSHTRCASGRLFTAQEGPELFFTARLAHWAVVVLLVVVPSAFLSTGVLAFEPLKASLLRCGAVAVAVCWIAARLSGQPRRDVW